MVDRRQMNLRTLVKISNIVAGIAIILLIYWVFTFISVQVFGLRIFRENISEIFAMSILGLIALMSGALMINVMFNLTRIAEKHNQDPEVGVYRTSFKWIAAAVLSFPLLFGILFAGDYYTSKKKESMLVNSAKAIVETNIQRSDRMLDYKFDPAWLNETRDTLNFFEKTEKSFPNVSVIVKDSIENDQVFLAFREYADQYDENKVLIQPEKRSFLMKTNAAEREYLNRVFNEGSAEKRFSASDGNYELYYPYTKDGKTIVLYFSDYQRYGKMGS